MNTQQIEQMQLLLIVLAFVYLFAKKEPKTKSRHLLKATLGSGGCLRLIREGRDEEYDRVFRFDRKTFNYLLKPFRKLWKDYSILNGTPRPNKRCITAEIGLGMILAYLGTIPSLKDLCFFIAATDTTVSDYIYYCLRILLQSMKYIKESRIGLPKPPQAERLSSLCSLRAPAIIGCIGFLDGKLSKCPRPNVDQERYYNGYKHMHCTKELFLFLVDGTIALAAVNFPGTVHDSAVYDHSNMLEHLCAAYPPHLNYWIAGDTAFSGIHPRLKRVLSTTELGALPQARRREFVAMNTALSGLRVASEWGIGGLYKCFRVLQATEPDESKRLLIKKLTARLWNVRSRCMDINQIRNVFYSADDDYL